MRHAVWRSGLALLAMAATLLAAPAPAFAQAGDRPSLPALHATRGPGAVIADAQGRQVLLRGIDLNVLGDYFQADRHAETVVPYNSKELDAIAAQGFDVIRLVLSWSKLEPERGRISQRELALIHRVVADARARGIYVVLDMHQDAWGKYIATPPGVTCPPDLQRAIGWDGAPKWATLTDGRSTCRVPGVREASSAVTRAFDNFYADRDGIEDQFVKVWTALARSFAADPAVAGYDLFNEPHYGSDPAATNVALASLYGRLIERIRAAEGGVKGGFSHIVFFEPNILWSGLGMTAVPEGPFASKKNIVFSPHLYGGSLAPVSVDTGYRDAVAVAAAYGVPMWSGEWGFFGDPRHLQAAVAEFGRLQDETLTGGTWWQWSQACGDPHVINDSHGRPPTGVVAYNRYSCPGSHDLGPVPQWQQILTRSYPRAGPGRLSSLSSDPTTGTLKLAGSGTGTLQLWVPHRGRGEPHLSGSGFGRPTVHAVEGGWRIATRTTGAYQVSVVVR